MRWSSAGTARIPRRCRDTTSATTLSSVNITSRRRAKADSEAWLQRWVYSVADRQAYMNQLGACRVEELGVKQHAYAAQADFGY